MKFRNILFFLVISFIVSCNETPTTNTNAKTNTEIINPQKNPKKGRKERGKTYRNINHTKCDSVFV